MVDECCRSFIAGPIVALQPAGKRAGTRLAVSGDGAAVPIFVGGVSAPFRSPCQLGGQASGTGRVITGDDSAASPRGKDCGAARDEVSGPHRARQRGGLRTNGRRLGDASLRHPASRTALYGVARRITRGARAHSPRAGTVSENTTAIGEGDAAGGSGAGAGSGDGRRPLAACQPPALRRPAGDESPATRANATPS